MFPLIYCSCSKRLLLALTQSLLPPGAVYMGGNNKYPVTWCPEIPHQEPRTGDSCVLLHSAGEPLSKAPVSLICLSLIWCQCSWLQLVENVTKFKALDKRSEGVLQFCSLNSTYKSRMQAVFVLGSLCAGKKKKKAGNFISIVKSFALSVFFMTGTNVNVFLLW